MSEGLEAELRDFAKNSGFSVQFRDHDCFDNRGVGFTGDDERVAFWWKKGSPPTLDSAVAMFNDIRAANKAKSDS